MIYPKWIYPKKIYPRMIYPKMIYPCRYIFCGYIHAHISKRYIKYVYPMKFMVISRIPNVIVSPDYNTMKNDRQYT